VTTVGNHIFDSQTDFINYFVYFNDTCRVNVKETIIIVVKIMYISVELHCVQIDFNFDIISIGAQCSSS